MENNKQTFKMYAIPNNKGFVVPADKVEEFKSHKPNPKTAKKIHETAQKFEKNNLNKEINKVKTLSLNKMNNRK